MGIDVYMRWKGQTPEEEQAQITGFSVIHGHVGYLREAYHGAPYAIKVLLDPRDPRVTEVAGDKFIFPAEVLKERLHRTIQAALERQSQVYDEGEDAERTQQVVKSFLDFVELAERKEAETGEPVTVEISA